MDDESFAVTNRLNIISSNGLIGFALIMLVLFLFLDNLIFLFYFGLDYI